MPCSGITKTPSCFASRLSAHKRTSATGSVRLRRGTASDMPISASAGTHRPSRVMRPRPRCTGSSTTGTTKPTPWRLSATPTTPPATPRPPVSPGNTPSTYSTCYAIRTPTTSAPSWRFAMAETQLSRDDIDALTESIDTITLPPHAKALLHDVVNAVSEAIGGADSPVAVTVEVERSVREEFDASFTPDHALAPGAAAGSGVIVTVKKISR